MLSVFFGTFAKSPSSNSNNTQQCLSAALKSFLTTYTAAAVSNDDDDSVDVWSPLGSVPPSQAILFIVSLLEAAEENKNDQGVKAAAATAAASVASVVDEDKEGDDEDEVASPTTSVTPTASTVSMSGSGRASAAITLCHFLTTFGSSSSGGAVGVARQALAKAVGCLPVPFISGNNDGQSKVMMAEQELKNRRWVERKGW